MAVSKKFLLIYHPENGEDHELYHKEFKTSDFVTGVLEFFLFGHDGDVFRTMTEFMDNCKQGESIKYKNKLHHDCVLVCIEAQVENPEPTEQERVAKLQLERRDYVDYRCYMALDSLKKRFGSFTHILDKVDTFGEFSNQESGKKLDDLLRLREFYNDQFMKALSQRWEPMDEGKYKEVVDRLNDHEDSDLYF